MSLSAPVRAHVFLRTFLLQAGWNYDRMQHLGFAFAMLPALRRIHKGEPLKAAAQRHLEYFNTHPYLAPALIGASIPLEIEVASATRRPDEVTSFKNGIMGSYGAIGDSFFWAALRPFGAVVAIALILVGFGAFGPLAFVLGYDAIALAVRAFGFFQGAALGPIVVAKLARLDFMGATRRIKLASAALAGLTAALWSGWYERGGPEVELPEGWPLAVIAFPLVVVLAGSARRGFSPAGAAAVLAAGVAAFGAWKGIG
jgi:mannose PTS system EIID component